MPTPFVFRRTRRALPVPSILLYSRPIPVVYEALFLGMIFDERLFRVPDPKVLVFLCALDLVDG